MRGSIGATLNRLEITDQATARKLAELLSASAPSRRDMAEEMVNYVREKVMSDVSAWLMAQMNLDAYSILRLLQF